MRASEDAILLRCQSQETMTDSFSFASGGPLFAKKQAQIGNIRHHKYYINKKYPNLDLAKYTHMASDLILPGQPIPLPRGPVPQLGSGVYMRDGQPRASLVGVPRYEGPVGFIHFGLWCLDFRPI